MSMRFSLSVPVDSERENESREPVVQFQILGTTQVLRYCKDRNSQMHRGFISVIIHLEFTEALLLVSLYFYIWALKLLMTRLCDTSQRFLLSPKYSRLK